MPQSSETKRIIVAIASVVSGLAGLAVILRPAFDGIEQNRKDIEWFRQWTERHSNKSAHEGQQARHQFMSEELKHLRSEDIRLQNMILERCKQ